MQITDTGLLAAVGITVAGLVFIVFMDVMKDAVVKIIEAHIERLEKNRGESVPKTEKGNGKTENGEK